MKNPLSQLLTKKNIINKSAAQFDQELKPLQLKMLRIQQGIWHSHRRAIILFEGFDAAGKGGSIRRLIELLDPRSVRVYPIGSPDPIEQGKHYLYRFWCKLPEPGMIAVFDRSWYGRVLVERVEGLTPKKRLQDAYVEINEFEKMLADDGIDIIKIFLAIHPEEQLKRFEARLHDPYKQWKLTQDDIEANLQWKQYVVAADELLQRTNTRHARWHVIPADSKPYTRSTVLKTVTRALSHHADWIESRAQKKNYKELRTALKQLERARKHWKKH